MHEITAAEDHALGLSAPAIEATRRTLHAQVALATLRAYRSDFAVFAAWCASDTGGRGAAAYPAAPEVVAAFLAAEADAGVAYATISRPAAAIRFRHASAQRESPTRSMLVTAALKGIRRELGVAPARKAPATARRLVEMVRLCRATLQGRRDRALLLGFAGVFRRSELVALQVEDLEVLPQGLRVTIRRSKTDQEGAGRVIAVARGEVHCPVAAVQEWLQAADITTGPVLRRVGKRGRVNNEALSDRSVAALVKDDAARAGFDAQAFSGDSLRARFLTSAAEAGAGVLKLVEVSRHRSLDTVRGYVRSAEPFKHHAGAGHRHSRPRPAG
jgi:site-specific recombinase XerD